MITLLAFKMLLFGMHSLRIFLRLMYLSWIFRCVSVGVDCYLLSYCLFSLQLSGEFLTTCYLVILLYYRRVGLGIGSTRVESLSITVMYLGGKP